MKLDRALIEAVPREGDPYFGAAGHQIALADIARAIRGLVPIAGTCATDDECARRRQLVDAALEQIGAQRGPCQWWTVVSEETPGEPLPVFGGVWAYSMEEALIEVVLWRPEFDARHIWSCDPDDGAIYYGRLRAAKRELELRAERAERRRAGLETEATLFDLDELAESAS